MRYKAGSAAGQLGSLANKLAAELLRSGTHS